MSNQDVLPTEMTIAGRTYEILGFLRGDEKSVVGHTIVERAKEMKAPRTTANTFWITRRKSQKLFGARFLSFQTGATLTSPRSWPTSTGSVTSGLRAGARSAAALAVAVGCSAASKALRRFASQGFAVPVSFFDFYPRTYPEKDLVWGIFLIHVVFQNRYVGGLVLILINIFVIINATMLQ